jgi:hypothetical protein
MRICRWTGDILTINSSGIYPEDCEYIEISVYFAAVPQLLDKLMLFLGVENADGILFLTTGAF